MNQLSRMTWSSPQEVHHYDPLYLANGTFGGLLDLSGTDMNLWSSRIVGAPANPAGHHGVHFPVTALRTQVYYRNRYFKERGFHVSRAAIFSESPIYTSNPSMPHKANVYDCEQSLDLGAGLATTSGIVFPGSRAAQRAGDAPERATQFRSEVVFLKDSAVMAVAIEAGETDTEITFDPVPVLEDRLVLDNTGDSIYSLGNEMKTDLRVSQQILHQSAGPDWICYVIQPAADEAYTVRIRSENGCVQTLHGRPVLVADGRLQVQVEILPQTTAPGEWQATFGSHAEVIEEQRRRWHAFWATSRIELPSHEATWQERYQASLFYTAQSVGDAPTHPVGLSQPMLPYWFGSFHDTDTYFCRPLLEAGHHRLAGLNLNFRHRTLLAAYAKAKEAEMPGALYPWQADPHGAGDAHFVPMNQAIIACEAWHQFLHRGDEISRAQATAIVAGIFENLLACIDSTRTPWDLKDTVLPTFSETIDARFPAEAILAVRATAEAYLALQSDEAPLSKAAAQVLQDLPLELDRDGAYRLVREADPEYLRCPSMTLGAWPLRHLPADEAMRKSLRKELERIVSVFAWMPHQLSALASRLGETEGPGSAYQLLKDADIYYKTWHAFDEWENRRTARAKIFVTAAGGFCTAIHHLLLAEGEPGVLRIFPGIPDDWQDCAFERLTTSLGWTVSARLKGGKLVTLDATPSHANARPIQLELRHAQGDLRLPEGWIVRSPPPTVAPGRAWKSARMDTSPPVAPSQKLACGSGSTSGHGEAISPVARRYPKPGARANAAT